MEQENTQEGLQSAGVEEGAPPASQEGTEVQPASEAGKEDEQYVPYSRFQEVIQQKNEFLQRLENTDKKYAEMQRQFSEMQKPKEAPQQNPLLARLKGIDPEFGAWAEQQEAARQELSELRAWRAQTTTSQTQADVNSTLGKLHTEHKVPDGLQSAYRAMVMEKAMSDRSLTTADLPRVYKEIHSTMSKFLQTQERDALGKYVQGKKSDSAAPTMPQKGPAPKQAPKKFEYSKDPEEARRQVVARAMAVKAQAE